VAHENSYSRDKVLFGRSQIFSDPLFPLEPALCDVYLFKLDMRYSRPVLSSYGTSPFLGNNFCGLDKGIGCWGPGQERVGPDLGSQN